MFRLFKKSRNMSLCIRLTTVLFIGAL